METHAGIICSRFGFLFAALLLPGPVRASSKSEIKAIRKLQKQIDVSEKSPAAQKVPVYKYYDDADDSIQWNSVAPEKDDPLIESGETLVVDHLLRRLTLRKSSTSGDWAISTVYYFRLDGTLAFLHSETWVPGVHAEWVVVGFYDTEGNALEEQRAFAGKKFREKIPENFPRMNPPLYRTTAHFLRLMGPIDILHEW